MASLFIIKSQYPEGLQINKYLFYRESIVYLLTLALLAFFMRDNIVDIFEALILCCMWPSYMYVASHFNVVNEQSKNSEDEESNKLIEEGKLVRHPELSNENK